MTKCCENTCSNEATHYVKIMVPALGHPIDTHQPASALMSMPFCIDCCKGFHLKETLELEGENNRIKQIFRTLLKNKCPPDFERAYVQPVSMTSKEAIEIHGIVK